MPLNIKDLSPELQAQIKKDNAIKTKRHKSEHRDEIDSLAYSIIGVLARGSCRTVRTQALKKALTLHSGKRS